MAKIKTWRMFTDCHHGQNRLREIIYYKLNYAWTVFLPSSALSSQAQPHSSIPSPQSGAGMGGCGWEDDIASLVLLHEPQCPSGEPAPAWAFPGLHFPQDASPCSGLGAPWCESVLLWSLLMGSTQKPAPLWLLPNLPQGWSALTLGELPSPHLSLLRVVYCSFFPPDPSCCAVVKQTCLPRGMERRQHIHSLKGSFFTRAKLSLCLK